MEGELGEKTSKNKGEFAAGVEVDYFFGYI